MRAGGGPASGASGDRGASGPPGASGSGEPDVEWTGAFLVRAMDELSEAARATSDALARDVGRYAGWVKETLEGGGRLLFAGNGGSAATAEHVAAEYAVRFLRRRGALPAAALTSSGPALTAAANDFGYEESLSRPLRAWGRGGDLLVVHSTSGDSPNIVRAVEAAREMGLRTVALTGGEEGPLARAVDLCLRVPAGPTARVQEIHLAVEHAVADRVDAWFAERESTKRSEE